MPMIQPLNLSHEAERLAAGMTDPGLKGYLGEAGSLATAFGSTLGGKVGGGALAGFGQDVGGFGSGIGKIGKLAFGGGVQGGFGADDASGGNPFGQKLTFGGNAADSPFNQKFGFKDFNMGGAALGAPTTGAVGGMATQVGGEWAKLDEHNNEINTAAAKFGVPANLIKSMINRESSGNWGPGYDQSYGGFRNDDILPFVGIFRQTADSWGLDYDAMIGNKQAQVDGMAKGLSILAAAYGGFENAAKVYFGGEQALTGTFVDELGMDSGTYGQKAIDGWRALDAKSGGGGGMGTWSGGFDQLWAGATVHDWGEFNVESDNGYYGYSNQYGLSGTTHTGLDIMGDIGTQVRSPVGGTVMCGGTGVGTDASGGGCGSFNDVMGRGAGRIEVQLDNGGVLIFGHSSESFVRPGQRINAGDLIGSVGGMNSAHIHLEARVRDSSTGSGWRIVDPRTVMGGGTGGASGGQVSSPGPAMRFSDLIRQHLQRPN